MEEPIKLEDQDTIEESTTTKFDERRQELTNTNTETKKTELGILKIRTEGIYHKEGIKKVLINLESQRKMHESNIEILKDRIAPVPEMTSELRELEEKLMKINMINYKKKQGDKGLKKDQDDLKQNEDNLKKINKDIQDIKEAIGTRINLEG